MRQIVVNADFFMVLGRALLHTWKELLLQLVGKLEAYGIVVVGGLISYIAGVGPRGLGS